MACDGTGWLLVVCGLLIINLDDLGWPGLGGNGLWMA